MANEIYNDETQFIIPLVTMNDGLTIAQIKGKPNGIYKDIQRSPFLRKSGNFTNGVIADIDITPLVRYGSLEQARIAPTLENVDIKLYYREPDTHKIPTNDNTNDETHPYADTYVWRELPSGFHLYNNDKLYGFEWVVLQNEYAGTDGIYNLHMNIEDGLGVCKVAASRGPVSLEGVEYKIIITAKNLWTREYDLTDRDQLADTLENRSDLMAPTVNAVLDYYKNKVETNELNVANGELVSDENGTKIKNLEIEHLTLHRVESPDDPIAYKRELEEHEKTYVDNPAKDEHNEVTGVHGIKNTGFDGNIQASSLDGAKLSNGYKAIEQNVPEGSFIPFVYNGPETSNVGMMGIGKGIRYFAQGETTPIFENSFTYSPNTLIETSKVTPTAAAVYMKVLKVGNLNALTTRISKDGDNVNVMLRTGPANNINNVTLDFNNFTTQKGSVGELSASSFILNSVRIDPLLMGGSSTIALKKPISELIGITIAGAGNKGAFGISSFDLVPNRNTDLNGDPITSRTMPTERNGLYVENPLATGMTKLGSALQALYELPLGTWQYEKKQNEVDDDYKTQLGIFVERVNQFRDKLATSPNSTSLNLPVPGAGADCYLVHKRNSLIESENTKIVGYSDKKIDVAKHGYTGDEGNNQWIDMPLTRHNNSYSYTDEEIKSIVAYFNLMTTKDELAQDIRGTVGVLLKAAKETQERLLNVETSVFGWDAPTVPGLPAKDIVDSSIGKTSDGTSNTLKSFITNAPIFYGLNRAIRAICLEVFNASELESILNRAEQEENYKDSSGRLEEKVTISSRMDLIDKLLTSIANSSEALLKFYKHNVEVGQCAHTYTPIEDFFSTPALIKNVTELKDLDDLDRDIADWRDVWDCHAGMAIHDVGRSWQVLPAKSEYADDNLSTDFSKSSGLKVHTPTKDECGMIPIPQFETDGSIKTMEDGADGKRKPVFSMQGVAWDTFKLQRLNLKVSKIAKDLYASDDVLVKYPNRLEVVRRNLINLVNDLYPHRDFYVEQSVGSTAYQKPFKKPTGVENLPNADICGSGVGNSVIYYFDRELFNKEFKNYYLYEGSGGNESNTTSTNVQGAYSTDNADQIVTKTMVPAGEPQYTKVKFQSEKLKAHKNAPEGTFGCYENAYSRLDLLSDVIGPEYVFLQSITGKNPWVLLKGAASVYGQRTHLNGPGANDEKIRKELKNNAPAEKFLEDSNENLNEFNPKIYEKTTKDAFLDRKSKTLSQRLSAVESALDAWAFYAEKVRLLKAGNRSLNSENCFESGEYIKVSKLTDKYLTRFEKTAPFETLKDAVKAEMTLEAPMRLTLDDLTDTVINFPAGSTTEVLSASIRTHNQEIWNELQNVKEVYKNTFVYNDNRTKGGKYKFGEVTSTLDNKYVLGSYGLTVSYTNADVSKEFNVVYVTKDIPEAQTNGESNANNFFVLGDDLKTLDSTMFTEDHLDPKENTFFEGGMGYKDFSEYKIYKLIYDVVKSLNGQSETSLLTGMLDSIYPVKSTYLTLDAAFDPNNKFPGIWKRLRGNGALWVEDVPGVDYNALTEAEDQTLTTEDTEIRNVLQSVTITEGCKVITDGTLTGDTGTINLTNGTVTIGQINVPLNHWHKVGVDPSLDPNGAQVTTGMTIPGNLPGDTDASVTVDTGSINLPVNVRSLNSAITRTSTNDKLKHKHSFTQKANLVSKVKVYAWVRES